MKLWTKIWIVEQTSQIKLQDKVNKAIESGQRIQCQILTVKRKQDNCLILFDQKKTDNCYTVEFPFYLS